VLSASLPALFLHVRYQPSLEVRVGSASADVTLADLAVAAVAVAAVVAGVREGVAPLRAGRWVFAAAAGLLCWIAVSLAFPLLRDEPYAWPERLVSAGKLAEYAVLAAAVPLLVRNRDDVRLLLRTLVALSVAATAWGLLQFVGVVEAFDAGGEWRRAPSFVGIHDFAALSAAALAVALATVALDADLAGRRSAHAAAVAGALGVVLSGALSAVLGLVLAAVLLATLSRRAGLLTGRRALALAAIVVAVGVGTSAIRGSNLADFAAFLGLAEQKQDGAVETYAHRVVLAYIGIRIWADEPLTGVGWQGSSEEWAYGPHLAAARTRFPSEPEEAFPSPDRPWGVQNAYVQTLADLGLVGAALLVGLFATTFAAGLRLVRRSPVPALGLAWLLVAAGIWSGLGLVAGIPLAALTWLAIGLAVTDA
jgi:O-antigen ligase